MHGRTGSVLVDAGVALPGGADLGATVVVPALRALGVDRLDLLVAEAARTTAQMSRRVGDVPDHCAHLDEATQLCAWEAGKAHRGYEVLSVAADTDSRVVLSCSFPSDGSERRAESCRVQPR